MTLEQIERGRKYPTPDYERAMAEAGEKMARTEMFLRMHGGDEHGRRLEDVMRSATRARFDAIFVDHIGMVGRGDGNELEQLNEAVHTLRGLSRGEAVQGYRPFVCVTTPLNKDGVAAEYPSINDFRGTSRLGYDSDNAIVMRKRKREKAEEGGTDLVDAFVVKNRKGPCPVILTFEAEGALCFITEKAPEVEEPPQHWQQERE